VINGHKIHSLIFPSIVSLPKDVENHGETIVKKAIEIKADVIISFGMASAAQGFKIEEIASNWVESNKYCSSYENKKPINPLREAHEKVYIDLNLWNLAKIKKDFKKKKIPFDLDMSESDVQYSCNNWMYRTICALKNHKLKIPYLFVHVPCTKRAIEFIPDFPFNKKILIKENDMIKALEIFLGSYYFLPKKRN
jgi:pyrrolidone-carboxylate peptidase